MLTNYEPKTYANRGEIADALADEVNRLSADIALLEGDNGRMHEELLAAATTRSVMINAANQLKRENADLAGALATRTEQYRTRGVELENQTEEIERLRDENERLKVDNALLVGSKAGYFCVYCGGGVTNSEDAFKKHDLECKDHPVAHLKADNDRLQADNLLLVNQLSVARECNRLYERTHAAIARKSRRRGLFYGFFGDFFRS